MSEVADFSLDEEEFPYPQRITRDAFVKGLTGESNGSNVNLNDGFDVDKFLYDHYRFTLLDDAQTELSQLLKEVDQELFDLLNNDYYDFINLGKTLDGGEGLVDKLRINVVKYQKKLNDETRKLDDSASHVNSTIENLNELEKLKAYAKNMILLDKFINDFEGLLSQNLNSNESFPEIKNVQLLKHLTSVYLIIHQLLKSFPNTLQFVESKKDKLETLHFEYLGLLDDFIQNTDHKNGPEDIHAVLRIYTVIGEDSHAVSVLRNMEQNA